MKQNDMDKNGFVTWDEYKKSTYGFIDNGIYCITFYLRN